MLFYRILLFYARGSELQKQEKLGKKTGNHAILLYNFFTIFWGAPAAGVLHLFTVRKIFIIVFTGF